MKIHSGSVAINSTDDLAQVSPTFPTKMELGETTSAKIPHLDMEIINCWVELINTPKAGLPSTLLWLILLKISVRKK